MCSFATATAKKDDSNKTGTLVTVFDYSKSVVSTEAIAVVVYVAAVSLQIAALATWSQCSRTDFIIITLASQSTLLMLQVLFSLPAVVQYFVFVVAA